MNWDDLFRQKNYTIQALDSAQKTKSLEPAAYEALALEGAVLEEKCAEFYLEDGRKEEAVTNLTSAASCYVAAKRWAEAKKALERAQGLTTKPAMLSWIKTYMKKLPS